MIPFPKKSPGNCLVLVEGSCGKVTHDLKLSGGSLRTVYIFLEANRRRVESTMAWAGVSPVGIFPHGAPSKRRSTQEDVRRCHNLPWLSSFGFEGDVFALPINTLWTLFPWSLRVTLAASSSSSCPPTKQAFFIFTLKAAQFL